MMNLVTSKIDRKMHRARGLLVAALALLVMLTVTTSSRAFNQWELQGEHIYHTSTLLLDGTVLVAGGRDNGGDPTAVAELFDAHGSPSVSATGALQTARSGHTATLLPDGRVLVAGGVTDTGIKNVAELYDPVAAQWEATDSMRAARYNHTATLLLDGRVLIVGGFPAFNAVTLAEAYDPGNERWDSVSQPAQRRSEHTAVLLADGAVLVMGGEDNDDDALNSVERYDPASDSWSTELPLLRARYDHTATRLRDGRILVAGGVDENGNRTNRTEIYNPATGGRQEVALMTYARARHTATLLPDGRVAVAGGTASNGLPLDNIEIYDPQDDEWNGPFQIDLGVTDHAATLLPDGTLILSGGQSPAGSGLPEGRLIQRYRVQPQSQFSETPGTLNRARTDHAATLLPNGHVLVVGGHDTDPVRTILRTAERFNPETGQWSAAASMDNARTGMTATLLPDGQVLVAGGQGVNGPLASAELYDPITDSWSDAADMPEPRYRHTATLLGDGTVLVSNGCNDQPGYATGSALIYDPATDRWATTSVSASMRHSHEATLLENGLVLHSGGEDRCLESTALVSLAQLYDPEGGNFVWLPGGRMNDGRVEHTATLLQDGRVLVAGGIGLATLDSAEIYDPQANAWTLTDSLGVPRTGHTATLLLDGRVLVAGGRNGTAPLYTTETFDPATGMWQSSAQFEDEKPRFNHTATLLLDGTVLMAGGHDNDGSLETAQRFRALAASPNDRPPLDAAELDETGKLRATTSAYGLFSEGSSGGTDSSPTNYSLLGLRRVDNGQMLWTSGESFDAAEIIGRLPADAPAGPWLARVSVNGIPSVQVFVQEAREPITETYTLYLPGLLAERPGLPE